MPTDDDQALTFRRRHRLAHAREFAAVYDAKVRKSKGPLVVFALPRREPGFRLGLSVGRPVGIAVTRNRIKRLLREAFRLDQHLWAGTITAAPGYDLVVTVRPHPPLPLTAYRAALSELVTQLDHEYHRRARRQPDSTRPEQLPLPEGGGRGKGANGGPAAPNPPPNPPTLPPNS